MTIEIAPETLSQQWICILTYYDKRSNKERETVFNAYCFNRSKQIYELKNPKLLDESIINKLTLSH